MEKTMHYTSVNHAHQAIEAINHLRNKRELCDIILRCNETRIYAHKLILSVNSPYFKGLMTTRYYMEPGLYEHVIKAVEGNAVQKIVDFFYTATVSVDEETVWTLMPAACKLHVIEIQNLCSDFLLSMLDIDNCMKIHRLATECLSSSLLKESTDFIKENFDRLLEEDCFLDLEFEDAMPHLKRLGDTGLSNEQVLHAIKCWLLAAIDERQVYSKQIIRSFPNLATKLEEFLPPEYLEDGENHGMKKVSKRKQGLKLPLRQWVDKQSQNVPDIIKEAQNGNGFPDPSKMASRHSQASPSSHHSNQQSRDTSLVNGRAENLMCIECAEEFDTKSELEEHAKTHKVYFKKENISPNQNNRNVETPAKIDSPRSMSYSPTPSKFSTPPRSFSPYEDYIKMNANKSVDFQKSLTNYLTNSNDDSGGGSYFDNYMRARGLDSPSFGQRYSRSPTPSRVQTSNNQLLITVTSGSIDGSDMKYICPICGKSYLDKDSLSRHYETHSHFPCNICGKSYSTKSNLHTHMKKHSDDKAYTCSTCDKSFTSPSVLKTHLRTHTGEKPFVCPTCGVAFAKNIHLKRHLSIHTGIKPHECKVCNKRFSRSDHLKRHVQSIHTQDRPHICSLCGKDFVRKYELNKHMKQCHWGFTVGDEDTEMDTSANESMDISSLASMHEAMAKGFVPSEVFKEDISANGENSSMFQTPNKSVSENSVVVKSEPVSPMK